MCEHCQFRLVFYRGAERVAYSVRLNYPSACLLSLRARQRGMANLISESTRSLDAWLEGQPRGVVRLSDVDLPIFVPSQPRPAPSVAPVAVAAPATSTTAATPAPGAAPESAAETTEQARPLLERAASLLGTLWRWLVADAAA